MEYSIRVLGRTRLGGKRRIRRSRAHNVRHNVRRGSWFGVSFSPLSVACLLVCLILYLGLTIMTTAFISLIALLPSLFQVLLSLID
jgi:hypothetical protein